MDARALSAEALPSSAAPGPTATLTQRTVAGLTWVTLSRVAAQLVQFVISVTLARLLVPAQFGLIAMYTAFSGFALVFVDLGFASALVQRRDLEERHLSSTFWLNIAAGAAITGAVAGLSPAIAAFYDQPRLVPLVAVASLTFLILSPGIVQLALLKRALDFQRIALIEVASISAGGSAGVAAAGDGLGVWSLVIMALVSAAMRSVLLWLCSGWRPTALFDRGAVRELWPFSSRLLGYMSVNYWATNADNVLIGRFVGVTQLGLYSRAFSTMLLPVGQTLGTASAVMFPALSTIQGDVDRVRSAYLRALRLFSIATFPMFVGLLLIADVFITAVYGTKWSGAVPLLRILCIGGLARATVATGGWVYASQGRTDWMLRWALASSAATIVAFGVGLHWGPRGVATGFTVAGVLLAYPGLAIPGRIVGAPIRSIAAAVAPGAGASLLMCGALLGARAVMPDIALTLRLLVLIAIGIASYGVALRLLGINGYREVLALRRTAAARQE